VLGTPRIPPAGIRARLIRAGEGSAAAADGNWGEIRWQGRTAAGQTVEVEGRGYRDANWRSATEGQTVASLLQAVGRGRSCLAEGVPVVVVTTENLGVVLVETEAVPVVTRVVREAAEAVSHCSGFPKRESLAKPEQPPGGVQCPAGVSTTAVANVLGKSVNRTSELLGKAEKARLIFRSAYHRGGWYPEGWTREDVAEDKAEREAIEAEEPLPVETPVFVPKAKPPPSPGWIDINKGNVPDKIRRLVERADRRDGRVLVPG
jgi:hypothetical protein